MHASDVRTTDAMPTARLCASYALSAPYMRSAYALPASCVCSA
jgi:hypothetical protein